MGGRATAGAQEAVSGTPPCCLLPPKAAGSAPFHLLEGAFYSWGAPGQVSELGGPFQPWGLWGHGGEWASRRGPARLSGSAVPP